MLVTHFNGEVGWLGVAETLDVHEKRVAAVRNSAARIQHDRERVVARPAAAQAVGKNWRRVRTWNEGRGRHALGGRAGLRITEVANPNVDLILAGQQHNFLLLDDAFVGSHRFLERTNQDRFVPPHDDCRRTRAREFILDPVPRAEALAAALEGEGPIGERDPDDRDGGVARARNEGDRADVLDVLGRN